MLAFVAGALALSACTSEDILDNGEKQAEGHVTFNATFNDGEDEETRTYVDGLNVLWSEGDEISVFTGPDTNYEVKLVSGAGKTTAEFEGDCAISKSYYSVFPYSKDNFYYLGSCNIAWNGNEQIAVKGSFDPRVPMLAKGANCKQVWIDWKTVELNFKNVYSFVKVTTDYKCKSITLTSKNSSKYLSAAEILVDYDDDGYPRVTAMDRDRYNYVTLKGKDDAALEAGTYYIAVLPCTLDMGFDLTFTAVDGNKTYTKSTTKEVTFKRGNVLNLGSITLHDTDIDTLKGEGTTENPYKIEDIDDLITMQRWITAEKGDTWNKVYLQTADIDANGREMEPIGTAEHRFWGTYDGGNHTIKNLCLKGTIKYSVPNNTITETNFACALFGAIRGATIKNLTIDSPRFSNTLSGDELTLSPLVGVAYCGDDNYDNSRCRIINCKLKGNCLFTDQYWDLSTSFWNYGLIYGGFVGCSQSNLEITDCTSELNMDLGYAGSLGMTLCATIGGYVGLAFGVNVKNDGDLEHDGDIRINRCRNNSSRLIFYVTSEISRISMGGFIGEVSDISSDNDVTCTMTNCVNNSLVMCTGNKTNHYLGGLVGYHDSDGNSSTDPYFKNCVNNGEINSGPDEKVTSYSGGINGCNYDDDTKFINCVNVGIMTNSDSNNPGGICYKNGTFTQCWNVYGNHNICVESAGDMTDCGQMGIDELVDHMNNTNLVKNDSNNYYRWKKSTFEGRDILDLEF